MLVYLILHAYLDTFECYHYIILMFDDILGQ